jgi:hypothetical protein
MLESLAALAAAGGNTLVSAMVTDGWEGVKARFAQLLGHGDEKETAKAAARLEQSRGELAGLPGVELEKAQAEQQALWRARLGDLLEQQPEAGGELQALVSAARAGVIGFAGQVEQHTTGSGQAQQAVLGIGVQNVSFGGQREPRHG